ncbi:MAG: VTT domain-containing protein [Thiogranum sp.]|nr:VTT domain-containing protein [Thiogranum sp.]
MGIQNRLKALISSKHLVPGLFVASFAESTVVPIPLETLLIPAMQANRERLWLLAGAALGGCLLGALLGYAIGYALFDAIGEQLIALFGNPEQFQRALAKIRENGFLFVLSVGLIPIPFQIAMLAAGASHYSLSGYILATLLSRGIRYYGLAALVWKFGDRTQALIERHKRTSIIVVIIVIILIWVISWNSGE